MAQVSPAGPPPTIRPSTFSSSNWDMSSSPSEPSAIRATTFPRLFGAGTPSGRPHCRYMEDFQPARDTLTKQSIRAVALLAVLLVAGAVGAAVIWIITEPRPAFSKSQQQALDLAGDADRGRLIFA